MLHVTQAEYKGGFCIRLRFSNGAEGVVDLKDSLWGPVFEPLKDVREFAQFTLSPEMRTICWPNGADLAPEYLHDLVLAEVHGSSDSLQR